MRGITPILTFPLRRGREMGSSLIGADSLQNRPGSLEPLDIVPAVTQLLDQNCLGVLSQLGASRQMPAGVSLSVTGWLNIFTGPRAGLSAPMLGVDSALPCVWSSPIGTYREEPLSGQPNVTRRQEKCSLAPPACQ